MRWAERTATSDCHGKQKEFDFRDYMPKMNFRRKIPVTNPQMLREYNTFYEIVNFMLVDIK